MAALPPSLVHQGFWVDHSAGSILGSTITLKSSDANIILIVLTLVITFAGSHLWDLLAFLNFLAKATDEQKDGIHHQIQSLLRNASSPGTYAFECVKMVFYWRSHFKGKRWVRLTYTGLLAVLCSAGFIAAGVLVSSVLLSSSITVLVQPSHCGIWPFNSQDVNISNLALSGRSDAVQLSWEYSKTCYGNSTDDYPACNVFVRPNIPFTSSYDTCPFPDTCVLQENAALTMDTGLLDSNDVFGINAKEQDRIQFRKQSTCGVLDSDRYLSQIDPSELGYASSLGQLKPGESLWAWKFGSDAGLSNNISDIITSYASSLRRTLGLTTLKYYAGSENEQTPVSWHPIPPFARSDADTTLLLLLGNGVWFIEPVDDPWFSAHRAQEKASGDGKLEYFGADSMGKVLGCAQKYQFCIHGGNCTSLGGIETAFSQAFDLNLTPSQNATLLLLQYQLRTQQFQESSADSITPPALKAAASVSTTGVGNDIPYNQWEIESKSLFAFALASIQKGITDVATGPLGTGRDADFTKLLDPATELGGGVSLCNSQKMKAPNGYSNINVFGLAFTVGVCGLVVLVNLIATPIMKLLARYNKPMSVGMRHWIADGLLQLQRRAFQEVGRGVWHNCEHDVPVTASLEKFENLAADERFDARTAHKLRLPTGPRTNGDRRRPDRESSPEDSAGTSGSPSSNQTL